MPAIIPFIPLIAAAIPAIAGAVGGGKEKKEAGGGAGSVTAPAVKNLFQPDQIKTAQDQYTKTGNAKWNQIMAGMGAGGGTGGPDVSTQIGSQANALGTALGQLNTDSGYGSNPMANLDQIMKGVEPGIGAKYSVYG